MFKKRILKLFELFKIIENLRFVHLRFFRFLSNFNIIINQKIFFGYAKIPNKKSSLKLFDIHLFNNSISGCNFLKLTYKKLSHFL